MSAKTAGRLQYGSPNVVFGRHGLTSFPALALGTVFAQGLARRGKSARPTSITTSSFLKPIFKT
jgi:hypothetical protein